MRINQLRIQAFGPFAKPQNIEFAPLHQAGLFLLDGPTGAGKSTVLSAICFALYGTVPGTRKADSLYSTFADQDTRPEVLLDLNLGERRFEILRWTAHKRPSKKKRNGKYNLTPQNAGVHLREYVDGEWKELATRADEASQQMTAVLGLNSEQFMRVMLLPQGEFATFLQANSKDREELLRKLFGTDRFEHVENYLKEVQERRYSLVSKDQQDAERLRTELNELLDDSLGKGWSEPAVEPADQTEVLPEDEFTGEQADQPAQAPAESQDSSAQQDSEEPQGDAALLANVRSAVQEALRAAEQAEQKTSEEVKQARTRHEQSVQRAEQMIAAREYRRRRAEHQEHTDAYTSADTALKDHERSTPVLTAQRTAEQTQQKYEAAKTESEQAITAAVADHAVATWQAELDAHPPEGSVPASEQQQYWDDVIAQADRQLHQLSARADDEKQLHKVTAEIKKAEEQHQEGEQQQSTLTEEHQKLETAAEAAQNTVETLSNQQQDLEVLNTTVTQAEARKKAAEKAKKDQTALDKAEQRRREAKDTVQDARDTSQQLTQRRLDNAAGMLAQQLAELNNQEPHETTHPCPVCGSSEHPQLASIPEGEEVTDTMLEEATQATEQAETALGKAEQQVDKARTTLQRSQVDSGELSPEQAADQLNTAQEKLEAAQGVKKQLEQAQAQHKQAVEDLKKNKKTAEQLGEKLAGLNSTLEASRRRRDELQKTLNQVLGACATVEQLRSQLEPGRSLLASVRTLLSRCSTQEASHRQAAHSLDAALAEQSLTVEQARDKVLEQEKKEEFENQVSTWRSEEAALAELAKTELVSHGLPLLDQHYEQPEEAQLQHLKELTEQAESRHSEAAGTAGERRSLKKQVAGQSQQLEEISARAAEQIAAYEEANELLKLVRGEGENGYRMRLGSYVLAGRLEKVAEAASERLTGMTNGRYTVEHDDGRDRTGRGRAGLDLMIRDHFNDTLRAAATLSGGETFMTSLSLALGLADVVQAEVGGVNMDTLFIDEGFGSLDSETLEEVMEVLDTLQSSGRTIGLVSHVEAMKLRIPHRVEVSKHRDGSSLRMIDPETM